MSGERSAWVPSPTQSAPLPSPASGGGLGWGLGRPAPGVRRLGARPCARVWWRILDAPGLLSAAKRVRVIGRFGLCVLVLSVALAGCGKRNAPTAPPDQPDTYPRPYPSE